MSRLIEMFLVMMILMSSIPYKGESYFGEQYFYENVMTDHYVQTYTPKIQTNNQIILYVLMFATQWQ